MIKLLPPTFPEIKSIQKKAKSYRYTDPTFSVFDTMVVSEL